MIYSKILPIVVLICAICIPIAAVYTNKDQLFLYALWMNSGLLVVFYLTHFKSEKAEDGEETVG